MHFKSMRTVILLLVGGCISLVVAAFLGYSSYADFQSQALVDQKTGALLRDNIGERLDALAAQQVAQIQAQLEPALALAGSLASANALLGEADENGRRRLYASRQEVSNLIRQTVADNPELLDAFVGWEPNAFGEDARFTGRESLGFGPDGRFRPYWYRTDGGDLAVQPLSPKMESSTLAASGGREGEYYLCPKETLRPCVADPVAYDYGGTTKMVTSFSAPILVDGQFKGSAGVDLSVNFMQSLLSHADQSLFDGAGEWALIAPRGGVTAWTGGGKTDSTNMLGQPMATVLDEALSQRVLQAQQQGVIRDTFDGQVELLWPFTVGSADSAPWVLVIRLPQEVVMAGLNELQTQLGEQRRLDTIAMFAVGAGLVLLGLLASWFLGSNVSRPLKGLAERMREIASGDGDLTRRLPVRGRNESAELAIQFNAFADKMQHVLQDVRDSSESVRNASQDIAGSSQELSQRTDSMAASLQQTSASMEELTSTVEHTAQSARQVDQLAATATDAARRGGDVVSDVVQTMDEIESSSSQIAKIVTTMNGIAFQTNLLALNASVEAARAGEHGKGFAVVAQEVRNLASRSAEAAHQIKALVESSSGKTQLGSERARHAGEAMKEIVASIARVTDVLSEISAATSEQSQGIGQVNQAVAELDHVTQQNAAMVQQSAASAESLRHQSQRLAATIGSFRLADARDGELADALSLAPPSRGSKKKRIPETV